MERGVIQFESQTAPETTFSDLDPEKIAAYLERLGLPGGENPQDVLLRRGCLQQEKGKLLPTYAGVLLLGKHPQRCLPNATIMAIRFPGTAYSDEFIKQEIRGSLPDQLRQAEAFISANLRSVVRLVGLEHQEVLEYPP